MREIRNLKTALSGNLALSHFKRNEVDEAEFYNGMCLEGDPENIKAHYRVVQFHIARKELKEAQEYAISCIARFKSKTESHTKVFKDILVGEIAEKIRSKTSKKAAKENLLKMESELQDLIHT